MDVLNPILARAGLGRPDGRRLHGYEPTPDEIAALARLLRLRIETGLRAPSTAQGFVLWAAERIRTRYRGGQLTWEFVYAGLGRRPPDHALTRWLVEEGLAAWGRRVRHYLGGHRAFLYSLLAEGGLPDAALAEAGRYREALLGLIAAIEAEGALAPLAALAVARRFTGRLPHALNTEDQAELLADLALTLANLRAALPPDLPAEAALGWVDAHRPGWRTELPLRLSQAALETIVRPALAAERGRMAAHGAAVQRELRRDAAGVWHGAVQVLDGGLVPAGLLPAAMGQRLRLVAPSGAAFLGQPEDAGWRLSRTGGAGVLPLAPEAATVLSAHADGQSLGELMLDPGLPAPHEAPTLWRPADAADAAPEPLVPLSGRGRTRAAQLWLLTADAVVPEPEAGLHLGDPQPGPGGRLWPVSGQGRLRIADAVLEVATGAEADAPLPRLVALGPVLAGWAGPGGAPVHLGAPQILGSEGETGLHPLAARLHRRALPGTLGGQLCEWVEQGATIARIRLIALPAQARLPLEEDAQGRLRLAASGLAAGWHLALLADGADARARVGGDGSAEVVLAAEGLPGLVTLRLSDPETGAALALSALWPARQPRLIAPDGRALDRDRDLSLGGLAGWRGHVPGRRGAVLMRLAGQGAQIGFPAASDIRLASLSATLAQALSLAGADGRINLRLADGGETPRLSIGRYGWASDEAGPFRHLGPGRTRLAAVQLDDPSRHVTAEAEGRIDLAGWLGTGAGLWFIQGDNDRQGVMRPFVWAATPQPSSRREARLARFAAEWAELLDHPDAPDWERLRQLVTAVREAGDAGGLDQVQALVRMPAAAVALVVMAPSAGRAAALALETDTPLWWPILPCRDWARGVTAAHRRTEARLRGAGLPGDEVADLAARTLARAAGEIVALRPELAAHLGQALSRAGLPPKVPVPGGETALLPPAPFARHLLEEAAQEAARRFDAVPQGAGGLGALRLTPPPMTNADNADLLHAPLVAAEVAAGLRPRPGPDDILRLIALRATDQTWFDAALPAALTLALSLPEASP